MTLTRLCPRLLNVYPANHFERWNIKPEACQTFAGGGARDERNHRSTRHALSALKVAQESSTFSRAPFRARIMLRHSGGSAALHHRLMSGKPPA